jgi:glycosyltransferase involved in cell wall biosynthesis
MYTSPATLFAHLVGPRVRTALRRYEGPIRNVFNSKKQRGVLISYLTTPFTKGLSYAHSNLLECYTAAELFDELGYRVDVVDWTSCRNIDYSRYDIIYGMGPVLEKSFSSHEQSRQLRIFYATGCNPIYSNIVTTLKVREFYRKNKILLLKSSRLLKDTQDAQIFLSDFVIVLGNDFVLRTYTKFDPECTNRYFKLNAFFFDCYDIDLNKKDFDNAKKNFLWFGSAGLLHKGLDVLLDIFAKHQGINLHICGASPTEEGFYRHYSSALAHSNNIFDHGFVRMQSEAFKMIMDKCGFVVFPSLSEGGAAALLNTMANGGLVPIITKASGLDLEEFGWVIEEQNPSLFDQAISEAAGMQNQIVAKKAKDIKSHVRETYTFENYKNNLRHMLQTIMDTNKAKHS